MHQEATVIHRPMPHKPLHVLDAEVQLTAGAQTGAACTRL